MAAKSKRTETTSLAIASDQFVFVEVPAPSNDNPADAPIGSFGDLASVAPDVLFTVGDMIFDFDDTDPSAALLVALDSAESDAAEFAAFSSSVMFVFGEVAAEA